MLEVVQACAGSRGWIHGLSQPLFFSETKGANAPLIIYHPFTDSQLDFVDNLLTDLKLQTEIEDSNKGAEMFVIATFGKATSKDGGGDKQRPHGPRRRHERRTIFCWVGNRCTKR